MAVVLLDGAMGTALERRGVDTAAPHWSAAALGSHPEAVAALHAAYHAAGATVHTAITFRTTPRAYGPRWREAASRALSITRAAVRGRVAGSLAPLEDCWHPERSPSDPLPEHRSIATHLAHHGADLLLCETFAHPGEAVAATRAAVATGLETWTSFTAGPHADLLTPRALAAAARAASEEGARRVLVNCVLATLVEPYVEALATIGAPFGVYANADLGPNTLSPERYAALAERWVAAGATVVGGCCGTGPEHIRALAERWPSA